MKICIWCKYGKEEADIKFNKTFKVLKDSNKCEECQKENISSTFMESKN